MTTTQSPTKSVDLNELFGAIATREYAWGTGATAMMMDRLGYYRILRDFFVSRPLRQEIVQARILEYIDGKIAEVTDNLVGEGIRDALAEVIAQAEAREEMLG